VSSFEGQSYFTAPGRIPVKGGCVFAVACTKQAKREAGCRV
jgi:hypothetical protein